MLKIILAILLPPVAAYLQVGATKHLWINIVLTLLWGIPGMIHALWLVLTDQQTAPVTAAPAPEPAPSPEPAPAEEPPRFAGE